MLNFESALLLLAINRIDSLAKPCRMSSFSSERTSLFLGAVLEEQGGLLYREDMYLGLYVRVLSF